MAAMRLVLVAETRLVQVAEMRLVLVRRGWYRWLR